MRVIELGNLRLAVHVSKGDIREGLNFYSSDGDFLQVGTWGYDKGKELLPHIHNKGVARQIDRTQEVVHVIEGRLKASVFSEDEALVATLVIEKGDTLILFAGGHSYQIMDDNTTVLEVKNGPYVGPNRDRRRFKAILPVNFGGAA